jgi:hypothetical protein
LLAGALLLSVLLLLEPAAGGASEGAGVAGAADESGVVVVLEDGDAGAGVLMGAESLGAVDVAGAGVSSGFLQPARAAITTTVANIVLRINIGPPFVV